MVSVFDQGDLALRRVRKRKRDLAERKARISLLRLPISTLAVALPLTYTAFSFSFGYGIALGISSNLPKILTISDFFRISLPAVVILLPIVAMMAVVFPINAVMGILVKSEAKPSSEGAGKVVIRLLILGLSAIFIIATALNLYYLKESVIFFGSDNPLGSMNMATGASMILAPLMFVPPLLAYAKQNHTILLLVAAILLGVTFYAGNLIGLLQKKGFIESPTIENPEGGYLRIFLVLDDFVVAERGNSVIAMKEVDEMILSTSKPVVLPQGSDN